MTPDERRAISRDQVVRLLSTDMTAKELCALNDAPESTLYVWITRFREFEPKLFGKPRTSEWIELVRESIAAKTALTTWKEEPADNIGGHVHISWHKRVLCSTTTVPSLLA